MPHYYHKSFETHWGIDTFLFEDLPNFRAQKLSRKSFHKAKSWHLSWKLENYLQYLEGGRPYRQYQYVGDQTVCFHSWVVVCFWIKNIVNMQIKLSHETSQEGRPASGMRHDSSFWFAWGFEAHFFPLHHTKGNNSLSRLVTFAWRKQIQNCPNLYK